ncbi:hypothetical protein ACS5PK_13015 [Roseateles sp. DB2]|uniref:hypothetical protein n=1 Tax=Roseateles sp. DB2 TaxID=3453717 RepID=UPI003EEA1AB3
MLISPPSTLWRSPANLPSARHAQAGMATFATLTVMLLLMGMVALLSARVIQGEQMVSEAMVQGHQRQSLQESGLDWGLHLLNSPALDADCRPGASPGPAFGDSLSIVDERGHRQVREAWRGHPFQCSVDDGVWHCHCPDMRTPGPSPGTDPVRPRLYTDQRPRLSLEFQGQEWAEAAHWHRRTLRLLVQSCAEGQAPCEFAAIPESGPLPAKAQSQLVVLSSALAKAPGSALISGAEVNLRGLEDREAGLALAPDPDSAWVLQAGGEVLGADAHVQGPPGSTSDTLVRRLDAELALSPEAFFKRFFGMLPLPYRNRAGLSVLDCRAAADCSAALEARIRAGQSWLWIQGPARLRSPLHLGSPDSPVLILCDSTLDVETSLRLTGLIYSHGTTRLSAPGAALRIDGAVLSAGAVVLTGRVQLVHSAPIIRRLTELRGSWVRLPGGWAA